MTDRDRLVELLKDTLHEWECDVSIKTVTEIAEHLISNGVIVLPCKVGDTVWWATTTVYENCEEKPDILLGEIASFSMQKEGLWAFCRYVGGLTFWHLVSDYFGKTVFLTREEAERALKE